jgi:hypothetical protein
VLDAYAEAGGNFIDTADCYSSWSASMGESFCKDAPPFISAWRRCGHQIADGWNRLCRYSPSTTCSIPSGALSRWNWTRISRSTPLPGLMTPVSFLVDVTRPTTMCRNTSRLRVRFVTLFCG